MAFSRYARGSHRLQSIVFGKIGALSAQKSFSATTRQFFFTYAEKDSKGGEAKEEKEASEIIRDKTDNEVCVVRKEKNRYLILCDLFDVIPINT